MLQDFKKIIQGKIKFIEYIGDVYEF